MAEALWRHDAPAALSGWRAAALALLMVALVACKPVSGPVRFHAEGQPATLAEWNLFVREDGVMAPSAGVVPYDLNTPLFSDYAHKLRTVWMPEGKAAVYDGEATFDFPVGTIISKTFYYPRVAGEAADSDAVLRSQGGEGALAGGRLQLDKVRLIETRLLVRREAGWVALPYVWNREQTEARLMRSGELVPLTLVEGDDGAGGRESAMRESALYQVPDQNQCAGCHGTEIRSRALEPIGPKARHLNRDFDYVDTDDSPVRENQLRHWRAQGYLRDLPADGAMPRVADWRDGTQTVEARARAYLDINCAHCHSPGGPGNTSGLWLGSAVDQPLRLGRCKLPIAAGHGTGDRRFGIVPGHPERSILSYRMISTDPGVMMPELGRSVVHREGVALIEAWIAAQTGECGDAG
ncbi:SO2930 family diheme c-type cytochrome [Marilutibacter maris]|nr:SO2930 family diheme c-type cytochrome [Lysobacter maris]